MVWYPGILPCEGGWADPAVALIVPRENRALLPASLSHAGSSSRFCQHPLPFSALLCSHGIQAESPSSFSARHMLCVPTSGSAENIGAIMSCVCTAGLCPELGFALGEQSQDGLTGLGAVS